MDCAHADVACVNSYEIVRKYECKACGDIMMCACEEEFARRHLPHQLKFGTRLKTKERLRVTLGFQPGVCRACRGLPEIAAPKAALHGQTSKVRRYYRREIFMGATRRFANWADENGIPFTPLLHHEPAHRDAYERFEEEAVEEIKATHAVSPKYSYDEKPQEAVLREAQVEILDLRGTYAASRAKGKTIESAGDVISVEELASRHFRAQGMTVVRAESVPFHVLFATLMYPTISADSRDGRVRDVFFGNRHAFEQNAPSDRVALRLPEDFGTPGYGARRAKAIAARISGIPRYGGTVLEEFAWLLEPSEPLRQYLWAHREEDIERARQVLSFLSLQQLRAILSYLCGDYWGRYLGWPALLVSDGTGCFFAEVKGSGDKLSEEQKLWIESNARVLGLTFKLVKVHPERGPIPR